MNALPLAIQILHDHCDESRCLSCNFHKYDDTCKLRTTPNRWNPDCGKDPLPSRIFEQTEVCPNCDREVTLAWDVDHDGYRVFCPNCGEELMLCDACQHADDNPSGYCDFKTDFEGIPTCFRRREHNDKTNN